MSEAALILLVEDNPDDLELALRAFGKTNLNARIDVARDGAEALDYLLGASPGTRPPVLVLLDLKLPRVDGLEVLRRLRDDDRTRNIPVVIMSSSDEQRDIVAGYGMGANSYIRKAVDFRQFTESVQRIGSYWLALNEPPPPREAR